MAIALKLSKPEASLPWGFRLVGGVDFEQPIVVVKVNADSLAESAGLEVGDIIVRVNDTATAALTHNEVHDLLLSAGLEFELGIRRGEITTGIVNEDDYDIEECESIKKAIEEEVLNEAIIRINNMKNKIDSTRERTSNIITENLSGQEEIVSTVTLQTALDVKQGRKWSTFLIKPDKPAPKSRKIVEDPPKVEPYKVVIKKQTRRPFQGKKVKFDQNVTELEVGYKDEESEEPADANSEDEYESVEVDADAVENDETCIEDAEMIITRDNYNETEMQEESERDSVEGDREPSEDAKEEEAGIPSSLEEQLLEVQKQLKALSQLPSAIQLTLDAVSKQLASIVGARESVERNGDQGECTSSSKEGEEEEPQTEEEYLEETSASEKAEAEFIRVDSDANSSIGEELEEYAETQEKIEAVEESEEREEEPPGVSPEEEEARRKQEELEAKREKKMEERTPKHIVRPIILPGGRKWSMPEDAIPSFRKPKMSDDKIIETIESNLEVIIGNRKGINFLKYQPPAKNLDYLQRSEVYRLVHDMEPPVRGITSRAEKVLAEQDYYEATKEEP